MDKDNTKIALFIGVPVLVGAAAYYFYYYSLNSQKGPPEDCKKGDEKPATIVAQAMKLKELGNKSFSRKLYDAAIVYYSDAIKLATEESDEPEKVQANDLAIFYQNRAACSEALGKFEDVVEDCSEAIKLNKKYVKAYLRRAKAFKNLKEFTKAIVDSHVVNFLEKFQNPSSLALAEFCAFESSKLKASERIKNCPELIDSWPSKQEIKNYFVSFSQDPIFEKSEEQPINSEEQLKTLFNEAIRDENIIIPIWTLVRGTCFALKGKLSEATDCFDKLFDDPDCPINIKSNAMLKKCALILFLTQSTDNIETCLKKISELLDQALSIDPRNPDIYLFEAKRSMMADKPDSALEALNKALELSPNFESALAHHLYIEFKLECLKNERSIESLSKARELLKKFPESSDIRTIYSQMLLEMNHFEQADEELMNLAKLNPTDAEPFVTRALIHMQLGDLKKAELLFEEARKIDPKNRTVYDFLGSIQVQQKNMSEATKLFEIGLECCRTEDEFIRFYSLLASCEGHRSATEIISQI